MKTILELLKELKGRDVTEFAMVSNRFPCVKVQGVFKPVDDVATSTAVILRMLQAVDGGERVAALGASPTQWKATVEGIGELTIMAVRKGDDLVQARIVATSALATHAASPTPRKAASIAPAPRKAASIAPKRMPSRRVPAVSPIELDPAQTPQRARKASLRPSAPSREKTVGGSIGASPGTDAHAALEDMLLRARRAPVSSLVAESEGIELDPGDGETALELDSHSTGNRAVASAVDHTDLDSLLASARERGASDLHVVAGRPALFRIAGDLVAEGPAISPEVAERMLRARVPERLLATFDVDGSADFALAHARHGRFRANVTIQRTGYKGSFRVISSEIPTLAGLGLPEEIAKATHHHQGLIVITGPTGHGKTTTLAALVDRINSDTTHHVITVEDPVEYLHPRKQAMISQREVGTHTKSFANALKGSLRQDPDVIVVGELRDTETVRMALSASETGHLVIGTMNTPSAAKTIDRLIDLFPPADQQQVRMTLAGGLRLIVSQRLLANTQRTAMVAASEVLPGSIALWNLIRDNKTFQIPSLQQRGKSVGIIRLDDSLAELVKAGKTTLETALYYAEDPEELPNKIRAGAPPPPPAPRPPGSPPTPPAKDPGLFSRAGSLFGGKKG